MKLLSYEFLKSNEQDEFEHITLFKKVAISPKNKDFLRSKVNIINYCLMGIDSGSFEWKINDKHYNILPNDLLLVCPGVVMEKDYENVEFGSFYKISLDRNHYDNYLETDEYSAISPRELNQILNLFNQEKVIILSGQKYLMDIFRKLEDEFVHRDLGHTARINALIDELLIQLYRNYIEPRSANHENEYDFEKLTNILKSNLAHHWTVKEMAQLSAMGVTTFTEKLKTSLGFSPFDYLIYLRINEAARLLRESEISLTTIALNTGFYSSQHFSNTFKKIMGYSPRVFRKNAVA